jgi:Ca2+-binding RTX toxin-like protein
MALIKGTRVSDTLTGTSGGDKLFAFTGSDVLRGFGGLDRIYAGAGDDSIDGGTGNDFLYGDSGADTILGGDGNDFISGSELNFRGQGTGTKYVDRLFGGAGNDTVQADQRDVALGGAGTDRLEIEYVSAPATLWSLDFSRVQGAGAQTFAGATTYWGTTRAGQFESVSFEVGNARAGSVINGSSGGDYFYMSMEFRNDGNTVGTVMYGKGGDDWLDGSNVDDRLFGGTGNDLLFGYFGDDSLFGGAGDDELDGGDGADLLYGGTGDDVFLFEIQNNATSIAPIIIDFNRADDMLLFYEDNTPVDFGSEQNLLQKGATVTNGTTAAGIAQFLYETDTGRLSLDTNGSAAEGVLFLCVLNNKANLTSADFYLL